MTAIARAGSGILRCALNDRKSELAWFSDVIAEPSPTGRDAAGRQGRPVKVTGEVRIAIARTREEPNP